MIGIGIGIGMTYGGGGGGTPMPAPVATWTSNASTYDPVFSLTQITVDDVVECQIDDNADFASLYDSDSNTVDEAEALAGQLTFAGITTLGFDTTYYARFRYTRGALTSDWSNTVSKAMDPEPAVATTWNPADKAAGVTLSNGNLTAVGNSDGNFANARGTISQSSGKRHFEVTHTDITGWNAGAGVANATASLTVYGGSDVNSVVYYDTGAVNFNGGQVATYATFGNNDIITVEIDIPNSLIQFFKNGTSQGAALDITGIGTTLFTFFSAQFDTATMTLNCGPTFSDAPTATFVAWDS